ncbi:MAG: SagB/ThcOx family dehydrogenase [Rikenellaceae bacterium]|nr:SagB/ThcOx family dehydrogenase [Rikenellaceae bacterium]
MKKMIFIAVCCLFAVTSYSQPASVMLNEPDLESGLGIMQALAKRESVRQFSDKKLSHQDISDLLWAANGVNRPESGKRTAPSAGNRQAIEIYLCDENGAYRYDAKTHSLETISLGDHRQFDAPVYLVIVANSTDNRSKESYYADSGIVSQNISLFCSGRGLGTVCRGSMDQAKLREALKLQDNQYLLLNHPVGYPRE